MPARHSPTSTPAPDPRLSTWERRAEPFIVVAALVPVLLAFVPRTTGDLVVIDGVSWLIFLADLLVHLRWQPGYLRTRLGRFDTVIVVVSFPWYLVPGLGSATFLGLARVARLLRLVLVGGSRWVLRRLINRLGKAGLYALALMLVCAAIVYRVEPASSGFTTYGDAVWWAIVTFTTVGYGDLVPVTLQGRAAATLLMVGGIALIGVLAGSMSELFTDVGPDGDAAGDATPAGGDDPVLAELRALRSQVADLQAALDRGPPDGD